MSTPASFLEDLIDACVMECYFREHMLQRYLLFHDDVAQTILSGSFPADPQTGLSALLSLNAPSHPIRNKLLRLTADLAFPSSDTKDYPARLTEAFTRAHDLKHPLHAMLADLQTIEEVRIIEGEK